MHKNVVVYMNGKLCKILKTGKSLTVENTANLKY